MFCFGVEPIKISSPSINTEVALEQVLEGCCLLCKESMIFVHQHKTIEIFVLTFFVYYYFLFSLMVNMLQPLLCLISLIFITFKLHNQQTNKILRFGYKIYQNDEKFSIEI